MYTWPKNPDLCRGSTDGQVSETASVMIAPSNNIATNPIALRMGFIFYIFACLVVIWAAAGQL